MIAQRPLLEPASVKSSPPLRPGDNMRLGRNPLGMWIDGPRSGADFRHPWLVTVGGDRVRIGRGYVLAEIGVVPVIGNVPISGDARRPAPTLKLSDDKVNAAGETWVCVQVTPDAEGKLGIDGELAEGAIVDAVQAAYPLTTEGRTGRAPLAMLFRRGRSWQVFQIAHFHLRYVTSLPADGTRRHFFL